MLLLTHCIILALQAWAWTNFTRRMTNSEVKKFGQVAATPRGRLNQRSYFLQDVSEQSG